MELDTLQREVIELVKKRPFVVLSGPPGCGKSTILKQIVQILPQPVLCIAPTGKAAQVLKTIVQDTPVMTMDKLLISPDIMQQHFGGCLLVDETSMCSMEKLAAVCREVRPKRLCLVGDVDQLPPPGETAIFPALLNDDNIPKVRFTKVFRQNNNTGLYKTIQSIQRGETTFTEDETFKCIWGGDSSKHIIDICRQFLINQKIVPQFMCLSNLTRHEVNTLVQRTVNPGARTLGKDGILMGDPVICTDNAYCKSSGALLVANGTMGIACVRNGKHCIVYKTVNERGQMIEFVDSRNSKVNKYLTMFELAYCITIHKSQGDQFKHVVAIIDVERYMKPPRSLLYTAISRAQETCIVLAVSKPGVDTMIRHVAPVHVEFKKLI
jgi:exodeoxyribonuclease V alpha subunit